MTQLNQVNGAKEMAEQFQDYLLKVTEEEDEEEKRNDKKIKTYIIEANIPNPEAISYFPMGSQLIKSKDPNLYNIVIGQGKREVVYVDNTDPRFWLLHTGIESNRASEFVTELVTKNKSYLDFSWFSSNFLEKKCSIGIWDGFGLKYENSFIPKSSSNNDNLRSFSMLLWGGRPKEVLSGLKSNEHLISSVSLSSIKNIYKTEAGFVKENINREGKFTLTKGDSFDSHLLALDKVKNSYSKLIKNIEDNYRIEYKNSDNRLSVKGTYSLLKFHKRIENISLFLEKIFLCTNPFRVFGIVESKEDDFIKILAVDLHTLNKFDIELTPDYMRLFLYENSCGNIITRLMTNLQEYYDSQISLLGNDSEQLI